MAGTAHHAGVAGYGGARPRTGRLPADDAPRLPVAAPRADDLEIKRIYLLQRFRGGGTGRQLVEQALAEARRLGSRRVLLGVYAGNEAAQAFYARLGFVPAGKRSFRVGDREYDDHILALDLTGYTAKPTEASAAQRLICDA